MADTEIDWVAYMEQVSQFVKGERDYAKMRGATGPLVYPAAHVYTYTGLYYLTDEGRDIALAQRLFAVLYMVTLGLVMRCYWKAKVPPYIFPLLVLSKRLHSIFVLRCFNDCIAVFFLWLAILALQHRAWSVAALAYAWGLGVKMTLLLALPALAPVLLAARGFAAALSLAWLMAQLHVVIAVPFVAASPRAYLARAFDLARQFEFRWTVNWRMLGEDVFRSRRLAAALLAAHAAVLARFLVARWIAPVGRPLGAMVPAWLRFRSALSPDEERRASRRVTPEFVLTAVLSSTVIGLLFARSLHYQFYAYLAWSTPVLLWRALPSPALVYPLWLLQEWAWNVYPSTSLSSTVVVSTMAITVVAVYVGTGDDGGAKVVVKPAAKKQ